MMAQISPPGKDTRDTKKTILIVEDDEDVAAFLLESITSETSYQVLLASNGAQARDHVQTRIPDLMLFDNHLPDTTGIELYDQFQKLEQLQQVPALLMSALPPRKEIASRHLQCLEKPLNLDDLIETIERYLTASFMAENGQANLANH